MDTQRTNRRVAWNWAAALTLLAGCTLGYAEVVSRDTSGGILALKGARSHAMEDAHKQMAAHCGPGQYRIVKEERVAVGTRTTTHGHRDVRARSRGGSARASEYSHGEARTEQVYEYRIHYVCGSGGGAAVAAQPAPPPPSATAAPSSQPAQVTAQPAPPPPTSGGANVEVQGEATIEVGTN